MIRRWESRWRALRRWFSRNEWVVRWLGLSQSVDTGAEPGLILIQIDGLAQGQIEQAIAQGRMPFVWRLMRRERYELRAMYSGLPSTTPAVQGELFYGVKTAVPAFSFRERETGQVVRMLDPEPALRRQQALEQQGAAELLAGGSAYCDIYTGGAAEAHFCASTLGWGELTRNVRPWTWLAILVLHVPAILRLLALATLEVGLALYDALRGAALNPLTHELKFVINRVLVCIGLRELMAIGGSLDATRGLAVVQVNFLGYDEQAHRRGPGTAFAHWTLKGIDHAIQRLWTAAQRSSRRDYDVWIYADHGQEATIPYQELAGRTIEDAVADVFGEVVEGNAGGQPTLRDGRGGFTSRAGWIRRRAISLAPAESAADVAHRDGLKIVAMGPVGHIYPPRVLDDSKCAAMAARLTREAHIPMVLWTTHDGFVHAYTLAAGEVVLPEGAARLLGSDHPFLDSAAEDLAAVCRHPSAGRLVFSGWSPDAPPISFAFERGGHAGPGPHETGGFVLAPAAAPLPHTGKHLRPLMLRAAALHHLGRGPHPDAVWPDVRVRPTDSLRVLTYNVHSCVGMDSKLSPARIARVIAQCDPDVVALQELDVGRARTGGRDQAEDIARQLNMQFHFFPAFRVQEELYGDAVLSRYPMRLVRAASLPGTNHGAEPRGALWVAVSVAGDEVHVVNTHLGLAGDERVRQVESLLGPDWLAHPDCRSPVILCGDFNALPRSRAYRLLNGRLHDVQRRVEGHRPKNTWFGRVPIGRIDHVFIDGRLDVLGVEVVRTRLACVASDHLPLVVDLRIQP